MARAGGIKLTILHGVNRILGHRFIESVYEEALAHEFDRRSIKVKGGGIGPNCENPGKFFYDNVIMGIQLIKLAHKLTQQSS